MTLELLIYFSLGINAVTLMFSFIILVKFKKIAKLTHLIYDQLAISKVDLPGFEANEDNDKHHVSRFEDHLSQNLNKVEQQGHHHKGQNLPDPLLESHRFTQQESSTRAATKAESHLIKVLQGKYASHDEESLPPPGN